MQGIEINPENNGLILQLDNGDANVPAITIRSNLFTDRFPQDNNENSIFQFKYGKGFDFSNYKESDT